MGNFAYEFSGGTHIVAGARGMEMVMLVRKKQELFTDFIDREAKAQGLKVVINGSFIDLTFASKVAATATSGALDPADSSPVGQVIQNGALLAGTSSTGKFHFSQNTCSKDSFTAGLGNPPTTSCSAIGGIAPIVVAGLPYGAENRYKAGAPANAPFRGDVPADCLPFLIQKSNAMYAAVLARGGLVGKTAIGFSDSAQSLLVLSQEDGVEGFDANGLRTLMLGAKMTNAVFLDCSDSATLHYGGKFLVKPGPAKDRFLTVAVGFR